MTTRRSWPAWPTMSASTGALALAVAVAAALWLVAGDAVYAQDRPRATASARAASDDLGPDELKRRQALCPRADASLARVLDMPDAGGLVRVGITTVEYLRCGETPKTCDRLEQALRASIAERKPGYETVAIVGLVEQLPCGQDWLLEVLENHARR